MHSCSTIELRRCRPLLGTFVEITAAGLDETRLQSAVNGAFAAMERIQGLMSAHDSDSELSRLNQTATRWAVTVSPETFQVLGFAQKMAEESAGAFDCTIAPTLARWKFLPSSLVRRQPGNWRDIQLLPGRKVHFSRPLALDLGGIAKGFAVDQAMAVLESHGVASAVVNAGGDLRVVGPEPAIIHLRHPSEPQTFARTLNLQCAALATSSPCFTERRRSDQKISHLINPATGRAITGCISVSVRAPECWLADALTKVVLNAPGQAEGLLAKYQAEACILTA